MLEVKKAKEAYIWGVVRADGEVICEYDHEYPQGRGFATVQQDKLQCVALIGHEGNLAHRVNIPQGATPVFFRRRSIEINPLAGESASRPTVHCIGWKKGSEATYLFCFDDGSTLLTSDLQAV